MNASSERPSYKKASQEKGAVVSLSGSAMCLLSGVSEAPRSELQWSPHPLEEVQGNASYMAPRPRLTVKALGREKTRFFD